MSYTVRSLKSQRTKLRKVFDEETSRVQPLLGQQVEEEADKQQQIEEIDDLYQTLCRSVDKYTEVTTKLAFELDKQDLGEDALAQAEQEAETDFDVLEKAQKCIVKLQRWLKKNNPEGNRSRASSISGESADATSGDLKEYIEKTTQVMQQLASQQDQAAARSLEAASSTRLPVLELEKFNGDVLRFPEFWAQFESSVDKSRLPAIEKFNYLRRSLTGDALRAIQGLMPSSENYNQAVAIIKQRFGKNTVIVKSLYTKLNQLPTVPNNAVKLRQFYDEVDQILRSLKALGENTQQRMLVQQIKSKFPRQVVYELSKQCSNFDELSMAELWKTLQQHVNSLEITDRHSATTPQQPHPFSSDRPVGQRPFRQQSSFKKEPYQSSYGAGNQQKSSGSALAASASSNKQKPTQPCAFCGKLHWSDECQTYKTAEERKQKIKGHCFRCLAPNHMSKDCQRKVSCYHCKAQNHHHRSLCTRKFGSGSKSSNQPPSQNQQSATLVVSDSQQEETAAVATGGHCTMMQTIKTKIRNPQKPSQQIELRILLDNGSSKVFISQSLAKKLQLQRGPTEQFDMSTFGTEGSTTAHCARTEIELQLLNGSYKQIPAYIWPSQHLTKPMKRFPVNSQILREIQQYPLADSIPTDTQKMEVDMMIGNDYYSEFMLPGKVPVQSTDGLFLLQSQFGWVLSGRLEEDFQEESSTVSCISFLAVSHGKQFSTESLLFSSAESDNLPSELEFKSASDSGVLSAAVSSKQVIDSSLWDRFVALETIGIKDSITVTDDDHAMQQFSESVKKENDRYQVRFPWKPGRFPPDNFGLAVGRLRSLLRRIKQEKRVNLMDAYNQIIQEQLAKGIVEKVEPETPQAELKHYLPHHPVITPSKVTTKVRVVCDASAKPSPKDEYQSLNECLYKGPIQKLMQNLCALLVAFRVKPIALVADIEKAFLNLGLQMPDRDVTRFLWLQDTSKPEVDGNLQVLRFCRVPFGAGPSPFLLAAVLDHHLKSLDSPAFQQLRHSLYVDNLVTGCDSTTEALKFYSITKQELQQGASLNLREWRSNSVQFMQQIPEVDTAKNSAEKVLGIMWNSVTDTLSIPITFSSSDAVPTKRRVAHVVAAVFDPMGLFAPFRFSGMDFLQQLWKQNLDWDDPIPAHQVQQWLNIESQLSQIPEQSFARHIGPIKDTVNTLFSLLAFSDASKQAYATAVYLKVSTGDHCNNHLIFAKSRPTPKKMRSKEEASVPRLELMGILIGVRALRWLQIKLQEILQINIQSMFLWSDSSIALSWLQTAKSLSVFVENRVMEIQTKGDITFKHVSTEQNPADIATRVCDKSVTDFMQCSLWWHGPEWLCQPQSVWPNSMPMLQGSQEKMFSQELKKTNATCLAVGEGPQGDFKKTIFKLINIENYSTLSRLLRVTAWLLRSLNTFKHGKTSQNKYLTAKEIREARLSWELHIQSENYAAEIKAIQNGSNSPKLCQQLGLQLDQQGVIRCIGRFGNMDISEGSKEPKLLPSNGHFTKLVIEQYHYDLLHCGVSQTLAAVRQHYWITQGRSTVKKVLRKCGVCRRVDGGPYKAPNFPPLPKEVSQLHPFGLTGLDYLGPVYVKTADGTRKVWVCLFTCRTVRAVHLEVVQDMTAEQFMMALRRFFAYFNVPQQIVSDNALQFKAAQDVLHKLYSDVQIHEFLSTKGVSWKFITEVAPWMGGFYERLVQSVKAPLKKCLGRKHLTYTELTTLLAEVQAVLNDRPLTYIGDDINSSMALTPNRLLFAYRKTHLPNIMHDEDEDKGDDPDYQPADTKSTAQKLIESWNACELKINHFWKLFLCEYLPSLRERHQMQLKQKRIKAPEKPCIGTVVLIHDSLPRGQWKMGKIVRLIPSKDGQIRTVQVQLPSGILLNRSVAQLYPFEVPKEEPEPVPDVNKGREDEDDDVTVSSEADTPRPVRQAAQKANQCLKQLAGSNLV